MLVSVTKLAFSTCITEQKWPDQSPAGAVRRIRHVMNGDADKAFKGRVRLVK